MYKSSYRYAMLYIWRIICKLKIEGGNEWIIHAKYIYKNMCGWKSGWSGPWIKWVHELSMIVRNWQIKPYGVDIEKQL